MVLLCSKPPKCCGLAGERSSNSASRRSSTATTTTTPFTGELKSIEAKLLEPFEAACGSQGLVKAGSSYRLIVVRNLQPRRFLGGRPRLQSRGLECLQRWHPSPPWRQPIRRRKNPPPRPCEAGALSHFGRFCPFAARGEPQRCNFRMRETRAVRVCIGSKRFPVPYTTMLSRFRRV